MINCQLGELWNENEVQILPKLGKFRYHSTCSRQTFTCLKPTVETLAKVWKKCHWRCSSVIIVNWTYFTLLSSVSMVDFEQVDVCCETILSVALKVYRKCSFANALSRWVWVNSYKTAIELIFQTNLPKT